MSPEAQDRLNLLRTRIAELELRNNELKHANVELEKDYSALSTDTKRMKIMLRRTVNEFKLIFENSVDAILWFDADSGRIINANRAAERLWGLPRQQLLGLHHGELYPPARRDEAQARFLEAVEKRSINVELEVLTANGAVIPVEVFTSQAEIEGKRMIQGLFHDISERKRAERELIFKNMLMSTQQEVSIDGILTVDEKGKIISFNTRFIKMWGIPSETIEKKSDELAIQSVMDKLVDPDSFLAKVAYLYEHNRETSRDEIRLKDGRVFDRYSSPVHDSDGNYFGRVWFFRDVIARKLAECKCEGSGKELG